MELSDYERRVLSDLERDLESRPGRRQLLPASWRRATRWVLLAAVSLLAGACCVLAGIACVPSAAAVLIGLLSFGLGLMWGLAIRRRPAG